MTVTLACYQPLPTPAARLAGPAAPPPMYLHEYAEYLAGVLLVAVAALDAYALQQPLEQLGALEDGLSQDGTQLTGGDGDGGGDEEHDGAGMMAGG